jgi:hypothetical protein
MVIGPFMCIECTSCKPKIEDAHHLASDYCLTIADRTSKMTIFNRQEIINE